MFTSILLAATPLVGSIFAAPAEAPIWRPDVATKFHMILTGRVDTSHGAPKPGDVHVWDVDLFDTPKETIADLKAQGDKIICYFSAGTSENWRKDYPLFKKEDKGGPLKCWEGENWLNIRSNSVFKIMQDRIKIAAEKGCDAIDPDNMDGYEDSHPERVTFPDASGIPKPLKDVDSINYIRKLAAEARKYGMAIGLKNAGAIIDRVTNDVQFAVNEECVTKGTCSTYTSFIKSGRPVFHVQYAGFTFKGDKATLWSKERTEDTDLTKFSSEQLLSYFCEGNQKTGNLVPKGFSTMVSTLGLSGYAMYCDGESANTKTIEVERQDVAHVGRMSNGGGTGPDNGATCDDDKE